MNISRKFKILWKIKYKLNNLYWNFIHRFHPNHQYNKIDTGLPPGYYDPCEKMLFGIMHEFCTWYERQNSYVAANTNILTVEGQEKFLRDSGYGALYPEKAQENLQQCIEINIDLLKVYTWWKNYRNYYWNRVAYCTEDCDSDLALENKMISLVMKHRSAMWYL